MIGWRRLRLVAFAAAQIGLFSGPASAQVTLFADNDARRALKTLQTTVESLEATLRERIAATEASIRLVGDESRARDSSLARQTGEQQQLSEARWREQLAALQTAVVKLRGLLEQLDASVLKQREQQEVFNQGVALRLEDARAALAALKEGRIEVSRALDKLREDVQKDGLAPLQARADQLARDLSGTQRTLRDEAVASADRLRKGEDQVRKLDERLREFDEALRQWDAQAQKALAERAAQDETRAQRLAESQREADQRLLETERRLLAALEQGERRSEARVLELARQLERALERAQSAEDRLAKVDERMAGSESRLDKADEKAREAVEKLRDHEEKLRDREERLRDHEEKLRDHDEKLRETEEKLRSAEERAREAEERLARLDDALRRQDERGTAAATASARAEGRIGQLEARWRQLEEQSRLRGTDIDLSPLGLRVGQVEDRLRRLEPLKVALDGEEFLAHPDEKRLYDEAIGLMVKGDFARAGDLFVQFLRRYPASGYTGWVRFWNGQALVGLREHRSAIASFRALVNESPNHPKAPEAMLGLASSQLEVKDRPGARKTLEDLLRLYPDSDASKLGRQRLVSLK